ncbi:MAG: hypothetical protein HZA51_15605 [Planctomycetes bacterium]|nr:hypothetical protein [Planctomycetota bacterium]
MAWKFLTNDCAGLRLHGGTCTVGPRGVCRFDPDELAAVGVSDYASVVFDSAKGMIGICKPEQGRHRIKVSKPSKGTRAVRLTLDRAIRAAGVHPDECKGRRCTRIENGILVVDLTGTAEKA